MTNEERDIITQFIARASGAQATVQPAFGGSVPATTTPALPPVDPEARYRITQLAFVQEHALAEAQNRIQRLEWELQQAQQAVQQAQQQRTSGAGGGFFSGLFGGGARPAATPQGGPGPAWNQGAQQPGYPPNYQQAAPPPQYAPGYQPGMFQRSGSGFLGSALTTAAGVAGGLVAGNALMSLFSGSHGAGGGFGSGIGGPAAGGPWGGAPAAEPGGYVDQGTWTDPGAGGGQADPGYVDSGTWDTSSNDPSPTVPDNTGGDSGWDSGGGGGSTDDTF
jgi:hypothetical protein